MEIRLLCAGGFLVDPLTFTSFCRSVARSATVTVAPGTSVAPPVMAEVARGERPVCFSFLSVSLNFLFPSFRNVARTVVAKGTKGGAGKTGGRLWRYVVLLVVAKAFRGERGQQRGEAVCDLHVSAWCFINPEGHLKTRTAVVTIFSESPKISNHLDENIFRPLNNRKDF